jgi:phosphoribosylamine--glycine ligase
MAQLSSRDRILVVGSGAREHALALGLAGPDREVIIAPGNAGTAAVGRNVAVNADDVAALVDLAAREKVALAVVGPELPLTLGLADALAARGVRVFGPTRAAAQLEGSKCFSKRFFERHGIPTADFQIFDDAAAAEAYVRAAARPLVVKADGLAAGKGVVVAKTTDEALAAVDRIMRKRELGAAGDAIVVEELLPGDEASFHVICDGERGVPLVAAQDHKRVFDGDRGPNTGGMGAYAPAPVVTKELADRVMRTVVEPTLAGMAAEGAPFRGVLFVGLMIDRGEARVLEFNVRFGDPETSVLVPMLDGDWLALLDGAARGDLRAARAGVRSGAALSVVMAAEGYPGKPRTGDVIHGLDEAARVGGAFVLHAGTARRDDGAVVTTGGRVLAVGARAESLPDAARIAYDAVGKIRWNGEHHRADIGHRALHAPC